MQVGYVVLYVNDTEACRRFWVEQVGMVEKRRDEVGAFTIAKVGFEDQPFAFELVPLAMMQDNPDNLDLATPSIATRNVQPVGMSRAGYRAPGSMYHWARWSMTASASPSVTLARPLMTR